MTIKTIENKYSYLPKEESWLSFNYRVLQEAMDIRNSLSSRIMFLGIYSSNLDEFFSVRVATLNRMVKMSLRRTTYFTHDPREILNHIQSIVLKHQEEFHTAYENAIGELKTKRVHIVNEKEIDDEQVMFVRKFFNTKVRPKIFPIMMNFQFRLPELLDATIYLAISMKKKKMSGRNYYSLIEIPTRVLSRFCILPARKHDEKIENSNVSTPKEDQFVILLDDVIRLCLPEIYDVFGFEQYEAYCFKISRDSTLELDRDIGKSYIDKVFQSLQKRKRGQLVRFVYDKEMPADMLEFILRKLRIKAETTPVIPGIRYHNFKDFIGFPKLLRDEKDESQEPLGNKFIQKGKSLIQQIGTRDIMLHFPFQSYDTVIDFLREAAIDPQVVSISITLYRVAKISSVVNALINAGRNGKKVTVLLELQARFDEKNNFRWANKLSDEGVEVVFGIKGLKVHSKLCMVTRREAGVLEDYCVIGTGNFNEDTARIYTDEYLFTSDPRITREVRMVFRFFQKNYTTFRFQHLLVSPFNLRRSLRELVEVEIANAAKGKQAYIHIKLNNLADEGICDLLYTADQAGVEIRLIVRGMFSLIPGVKGQSENIQARCIVDKYLEHSRMLLFCNGGEEKIFIGSADFLPRNLDQRVEVTTPIYDLELKKELRDIFNILWADNVKSRILDENMNNTYVKCDGATVHAQNAIYDYLKKIHS